MDAIDRPRSPDLQVWKWHLTMVLSITHRASGMLLAAGSGALAFWLICAGLGPGQYAIAQAFFRSPIGVALLMLWSWSLFFHLCNGVRHLFWDAVKGYELPTAFASAWAVLIVSSALTIISWAFGFIVVGGAA